MRSPAAYEADWDDEAANNDPEATSIAASLFFVFMWCGSIIFVVETPVDLLANQQRTGHR
jgi:hypothetical protein